MFFVMCLFCISFCMFSMVYVFLCVFFSCFFSFFVYLGTSFIINKIIISYTKVREKNNSFPPKKYTVPVE